MTTHRLLRGNSLVDMTGQVFGTLRAEERVSSQRTSGNAIWRFICLRCGTSCTRDGAQVRMHAREGEFPRCLTCASSYRRRVLRERFLETGKWWTAGDTAKLVASVSESLSSAGYPAPVEQVSHLRAVHAQYRNRETEARFGHIRPVNAPEDHVLVCCACAAQFTAGFGCITCIEPVCAACEQGHLHVCVSPEAEWTLEEVGRALGFTREYARQVEQSALAKLRLRGRGLREFLNHNERSAA